MFILNSLVSHVCNVQPEEVFANDPLKLAIWSAWKEGDYAPFESTIPAAFIRTIRSVITQLIEQKAPEQAEVLSDFASLQLFLGCWEIDDKITKQRAKRSIGHTFPFFMELILLVRSEASKQGISLPKAALNILLPHQGELALNGPLGLFANKTGLTKRLLNKYVIEELEKILENILNAPPFGGMCHKEACSSIVLRLDESYDASEDTLQRITGYTWWTALFQQIGSKLFRKTDNNGVSSQDEPMLESVREKNTHRVLVSNIRGRGALLEMLAQHQTMARQLLLEWVYSLIPDQGDASADILELAEELTHSIITLLIELDLLGLSSPEKDESVKDLRSYVDGFLYTLLSTILSAPGNNDELPGLGDQMLEWGKLLFVGDQEMDSTIEAQINVLAQTLDNLARKNAESPLATWVISLLQLAVQNPAILRPLLGLNSSFLPFLEAFRSDTSFLKTESLKIVNNVIGIWLDAFFACLQDNADKTLFEAAKHANVVLQATLLETNCNFFMTPLNQWTGELENMEYWAAQNIGEQNSDNSIKQFLDTCFNTLLHQDALYVFKNLIESTAKDIFPEGTHSFVVAAIENLIQHCNVFRPLLSRALPLLAMLLRTSLENFSRNEETIPENIQNNLEQWLTFCSKNTQEIVEILKTFVPEHFHAVLFPLVPAFFELVNQEKIFKDWVIQAVGRWLKHQKVISDLIDSVDLNESIAQKEGQKFVGLVHALLQILKDPSYQSWIAPKIADFLFSKEYRTGASKGQIDEWIAQLIANCTKAFCDSEEQTHAMAGRIASQISDRTKALLTPYSKPTAEVAHTAGQQKQALDAILQDPSSLENLAPLLFGDLPNAKDHFLNILQGLQQLNTSLNEGEWCAYSAWIGEKILGFVDTSQPPKLTLLHAVAIDTVDSLLDLSEEDEFYVGILSLISAHLGISEQTAGHLVRLFHLFFWKGKDLVFKRCLIAKILENPSLQSVSGLLSVLTHFTQRQENVCAHFEIESDIFLSLADSILAALRPSGKDTPPISIGIRSKTWMAQQVLNALKLKGELSGENLKLLEAGLVRLHANHQISNKRIVSILKECGLHLNEEDAKQRLKELGVCAALRQILMLEEEALEMVVSSLPETLQGAAERTIKALLPLLDDPDSWASHQIPVYIEALLVTLASHASHDQQITQWICNQLEQATSRHQEGVSLNENLYLTVTGILSLFGIGSEESWQRWLSHDLVSLMFPKIQLQLESIIERFPNAWAEEVDQKSEERQAALNKPSLSNQITGFTTRIAPSLVRFIDYHLRAEDHEGVQGIVLLKKSIESFADSAETTFPALTTLLRNWVASGGLDPFVALFENPRQRDAEDKSVAFVQNVVTNALHAAVQKAVSWNKNDFEKIRALFSEIFSLSAEHLKRARESGRAPEVNDFSALGAEGQEARLRLLGKKILKLFFPDGKDDLLFLPAGQRKFVWDMLKTTLLPKVLVAMMMQLLQSSSVKKLLISAIETGIDSFDPTRPEEEALEIETESDDRMMKEAGALILQFADLLPLPKFLRDKIGTEDSLSPMMQRAVGSALRKNLDGDFIENTISKLLEQPFEMNPEQAEDEAALDQQLKDMIQTLVMRGITYLPKRWWHQLQQTMDSLIEGSLGRVGKGIKIALDYICRFIFFTLIGNFLGLFLIIPKLLINHRLEQIQEILVSFLCRAPDAERDQSVPFHQELIFRVIDKVVGFERVVV